MRLGRLRAQSRRQREHASAGGVADQALSSLSNFLLVIAIVRQVTVVRFGACGLVYSIFIIAIVRDAV